jgi:hypothetical protein
MRNSIVLFELLLSIVIFSIVGVYTMIFLTKIEQENQQNFDQNILKLQLYSANNILINRKQNGLNTNLTLKDNILYLENNIFLKDVTKYEKNDTLNICLKDMICQKIPLK